MRLLIVNYEFPPLGAGAGNATGHLARHIARNGHDVLVLTSGMAAKGLHGISIQDGYEVFRIPSLRRHVEQCSPHEMLAFTSSALLHAGRAVRRIKAQVMIVFFGLPCGPIGWWTKKVYGLPYVLSLRGGDIPGIPYGSLAACHRMLSPINATVWGNASAIAVTSVGFQELAQRFAGRVGKRVLRIPNGVDCESFYPAPFHLHEAPVKILYVGRVVKTHKGLEHLLPAVKKLVKNNRQEMELEIVGDGEFRIELEILSKELGLQDVVRFSGWARRENLLSHFHSAHIFVHPSVGDGMTNSILEAMACGLPIVTTPSSGQHLVEDHVNGLLVSPDDSSSLAEALAKLVDQADLRAEMGRASRQKAIGLSWEIVAQRYLNLAHSALSSFPAKRNSGAVSIPAVRQF
jgi:glycosyltransferase involved in cell wall biosynthesis